MTDRNEDKKRRAKRRRRRVRGKIVGTSVRPRMTVSRSLKSIMVQIVDDENQKTLVGVGSGSTIVRDVCDASDTKTTIARKVGMKAAELARAKGIETVVFDRNRFRYHGRIKAVAEGAREGGLTL